jgi:hypothetical protein
LPSSEQGLFSSPELLFVPADVPELLDVIEELLLESVEELDFAEEELFVDDDETLLLDLSSLLLQDEGLEPSWLSPLRVAPLSEDSFSGLTKLLLSSSPQATNKKANASVKKRRMDPRPFDQG